MNMDLYKPFGFSAKNIIEEMANVDIDGLDDMKEESEEISSMGVASIITFVGKRKGRLLMDMEPNLALHITNTILGEEYKDLKERMVLSMISEINNMVSGNAITSINDDYSMSLRLAPPIVFAGKDVVISIPKIKSISTWGDTPYGRIRLNIAWEGAKD